jgi:hypothetical protein
MREQLDKKRRPGICQTLERLSERTLGGSSPPATCVAQVTKELEENEPQEFWKQLRYTSASHERWRPGRQQRMGRTVSLPLGR